MSESGRDCHIFTELSPLAIKLDYLSQTPLQLSRIWLSIGEWAETEVIYTTSSLAPKNLCNPLYALILFSFIGQMEAENPGEDSMALEDGRASVWKGPGNLRDYMD